MPEQGPGVSTKPYLVRAIYEWCTDSGYRPFIAVAVDERTMVPLEFVRDGEIVLNISAGATDRLQIGNDLLEFDARFGGVARHVSIPIDNIGAIFAQETGHGMAFEITPAPDPARQASDPPSAEDEKRSLRTRKPAAGPAADGAESEGGDAKAAPGTRRSGRRKASVSALTDVVDASFGTSGSDSPPPRKAPARRARKTVLRDVSAAKETPPEAAPTGLPDGDDPDPDKPKPGKPRLTRVK